MKLMIFLISIIAVLLTGCVSHRAVPFYNTSQWDSYYTGGDGSSTEQAVIINTTDPEQLEDAEKNYLDSMLTNKGKSYKIINKLSYNEGGRIFDKFELLINNSTQRDYHFDVTKASGSLTPPTGN